MHKIAIKQKTVCNYFLPFWGLSFNLVHCFLCYTKCSDGKELWQYRRSRFDPWVGKIPWSGKWQPTPVFFPGAFHRQRSVVGYSPWGHKESDTIEWLTLAVQKLLIVTFVIFVYFCFFFHYSRRWIKEDLAVTFVYLWHIYTLIYGRNQHNIVKLLSSNLKKNSLDPI